MQHKFFKIMGISALVLAGLYFMFHQPAKTEEKVEAPIQYYTFFIQDNKIFRCNTYTGEVVFTGFDQEYWKTRLR